MKAPVLLVALLACTACERTPVAQSPAPKPFHPAVRFVAYNGAPPKFTEMTFQVNATGRSEFLHLGDMIPKTTMRLVDFDPATRELIVSDTTSTRRARLSLPKPVNSPSAY